MEDSRKATIELAGGESITLKTPERKVHRLLGSPALIRDEGPVSIWILADGTEVAFQAGVVISIRFSEDATFSSSGHYQFHRVRHHGGVGPTDPATRGPLDMSRPVKVREHLRRLPSGRVTVVRQHTRSR